MPFSPSRPQTTVLRTDLLPDPSNGRFWLGVVVCLSYQCALSFGGLSEYILHHPRSNIVHANKEGLCSSIGMFALFLLASAITDWLLNPSKHTVEEWGGEEEGKRRPYDARAKKLWGDWRTK